MTLPPSMSDQQAVDNAKKVLQDRIQDNNPQLSPADRDKINNHLGEEPKQDVQTLLDATKPPVGLSAAESPVCCLYVVNNKPFCVCQVSASECHTLGGCVVNPCPDPPGQHGYLV